MIRSTIFNKPALLSWLFKYSVFHAQMLAHADMISGSTIQGTELFLMLLNNIWSRAMHNLHIIDKFVALMVTYTKNTSPTGHDKCGPHMLDSVTLDFMCSGCPGVRCPRCQVPSVRVSGVDTQ